MSYMDFKEKTSHFQTADIDTNQADCWQSRAMYVVR
jgi:hypothetical protein